MNIVEMNDGEKITYSTSETKLTLNSELTLDLSKYQRDFDVVLDICANKDKQLVIGTKSGEFYVAQILIPAKEYEITTTEVSEDKTTEETEYSQTSEQKELIPLDMSDVTLNLWSIENILGGNE